MKLGLNPAVLDGTDRLMVSMEGTKDTTCKPKLRARGERGREKDLFLPLFFHRPLKTACNGSSKTRVNTIFEQMAL